MKTGIVHSSYGDITIDMRDGSVIDHGMNDEYKDVVRFDLDEYFRTYPNESRDVVDEFDILDLGGWSADGSYMDPAHDWRRDCAAERASQKAGTLNVIR